MTAPGEGRRQWPRQPSDAETTCRPAVMGDDTRRPAAVRDVSLGGIGLLVADPVEAGWLLSIDLPGGAGRAGVALLACVIHAAPQAGGWHLGCSFLRELSDQEFRAFLT